MKVNCQIRTARELAWEYEGSEKSNRIINPRIDDYGDLLYELKATKDTPEEFVGVSADSVAHFISMPNWEVVKIDDCGDDVNALFFYEED